MKYTEKQLKTIGDTLKEKINAMPWSGIHGEIIVENSDNGLGFCVTDKGQDKNILSSLFRQQLGCQSSLIKSELLPKEGKARITLPSQLASKLVEYLGIDLNAPSATTQPDTSFGATTLYTPISEGRENQTPKEAASQTTFSGTKTLYTPIRNHASEETAPKADAEKSKRGPLTRMYGEKNIHSLVNNKNGFGRL